MPTHISAPVPREDYFCCSQASTASTRRRGVVSSGPPRGCFGETVEGPPVLLSVAVHSAEDGSSPTAALLHAM